MKTKKKNGLYQAYKYKIVVWQYLKSRGVEEAEMYRYCNLEMAQRSLTFRRTDKNPKAKKH